MPPAPPPSQLTASHLILPRLYQGLSPVSSALPVPLLAAGKGKPLLFEKTTVLANRTVTRPGRRRPWLIKSECGPSSGVGTLGWPDRCRRGGPPPRRGGKDCCVAPRFQAQLSSGQNTDGASPGQDLGSDHTRCDPPVPIFYTGLYSFQQTHSSRHWFSHSGWDPVAVISGRRLRKAEPQLLHKPLALWDSQARVLVTLSLSPPISFILQEWAPRARCWLPVLPELAFRKAGV